MYGRIPSFMKSSGSLTKLHQTVVTELNPIREERRNYKLPGPADYQTDRYHKYRQENRMRETKKSTDPIERLNVTLRLYDPKWERL